MSNIVIFKEVSSLIHNSAHKRPTFTGPRHFTSMDCVIWNEQMYMPHAHWASSGSFGGLGFWCDLCMMNVCGSGWGSSWKAASRGIWHLWRSPKAEQRPLKWPWSLTRTERSRNPHSVFVTAGKSKQQRNEADADTLHPLSLYDNQTTCWKEILRIQNTPLAAMQPLLCVPVRFFCSDMELDPWSPPVCFTGPSPPSTGNVV